MAMNVTSIQDEDTGRDVAEPMMRLVGEGLFDWPLPQNVAASLHGAKCQSCQEVVFPSLADCPLCMKPNTMVSFELAGKGTLVDFAVTERGPAGFEVPYIQAYIRLDDCPILYSMLTNVEPTEFGPRLGESMEMTLGIIRREGSIEIVGWKFQPERRTP